MALKQAPLLRKPESVSAALSDYQDFYSKHFAGSDSVPSPSAIKNVVETFSVGSVGTALQRFRERALGCSGDEHRAIELVVRVLEARVREASSRPKAPKPKKQFKSYFRPGEEVCLWDEGERVTLSNLIERAKNRSRSERVKLVEETTRLLRGQNEENRKKYGLPEGKYSGKFREIPAVEGGEAIFISDAHGSFAYLTTALEITNFVERVQNGEPVYLVGLGDYVDRLPTGCEFEEFFYILDVLSELKQRFPENVVLVRGDHETRSASPAGFREELSKSDPELEKKYVDGLFEEMPVVAITGNGVIGFHGGIPEGVERRSDLYNLSDEQGFQSYWNDPKKFGDMTTDVFSPMHFEGFLGFYYGNSLDMLSELDDGADEARARFDIRSFYNGEDFDLSPRGKRTRRFSPGALIKFFKRTGTRMLVRGHSAGGGPEDIALFDGRIRGAHKGDVVIAPLGSKDSVTKKTVEWENLPYRYSDIGEEWYTPKKRAQAPGCFKEIEDYIRERVYGETEEAVENLHRLIKASDTAFATVETAYYRWLAKNSRNK